MSTNNRVLISCVSGEFEKPESPFPVFRWHLRHYLTRADCEVKVQEDFRQTDDRDTLEKLVATKAESASRFHEPVEFEGRAGYNFPWSREDTPA
jgi:hypothetical protein